MNSPLSSALTPLSSGQTVAMVLQKNLICCSPHRSVQQAAQLMQQHNISCILIKNEEGIIGIWTESDCKKLDLSDNVVLQQAVSEVMSSPVLSVPQQCSTSDAAALMKQQNVRRLLVTDQAQQAIGIVTQTDLIYQQPLEHYLMLRDISSILVELPLLLQANLTVAQAALLMRQTQRDAAIVQLENAEYGIVTERDLVHFIATDRTLCLLAEVATRPLLTLPLHSSLLQAVRLLREHGFRHLGVTNSDGKPAGLLSHNHILLNMEHLYISELKAALLARDKALRSSESSLRLASKVIEASHDAVMITDASGIIQSVNPSFCKLTGYSAEEAIGQTPNLLSSGKHDGTFYQQMWQRLQQQGYWQGEIWNKRKNGELYPEWLSISAVRGDCGTINQYAAIFSDITERKKREQKIHELAYFDELTGLANRRLYQDRLEQALANAKRHNHQLAVLFLDLDLFKRINDTLGHQAGDEALRQVARRLQKASRAGESVARLGGDEFTVLVPECNGIAEIEKLAQRIVAQFERPFQIQHKELVLTTSLGISIYPQHGSTASELLKFADTAMYQAKESGRNKYSLYTSSVGQRNDEALQLEQALRQALAQQQLEVHYQPKIDLQTGQLHSLEALVRWHDKDLGQVSPQRFIAIAETLGLIQQLGQQVLRQVCYQLQAWAELAVPVAVNISAKELADPLFIPQLMQILSETAVNPKLLELEITESCLLPEREHQTRHVLQQLRQLGIRLAIDDFGTGYSSLSYLRHIPINSLKIDRSFIKALPDNTSDKQITSAIIAMANALGLDVIAEGIETQAQQQFLLAAGCQYGQGYWFGKAQDATQTALLLQKTKLHSISSDRGSTVAEYSHSL
ncbi:MAG: EAL domain-containing protein [Gammaproteobacteria bacterium]|nr:EAL domain-containing protein [Gammaproteobacteria bacterium]MBU2056417.1 EAL domain-containing protein [Gammaproteobacteria bacterium]MBU2175511.1 EAL domain-containing protein [Gammaproteobacteria bacterium]MBU2246666.1 EAL domain-containing protein [Gammaproteobacteria bacterium]MBU2345870.1 EAL domain-containing protein [Gammaproteobacteria bacterium]